MKKDGRIRILRQKDRVDFHLEKHRKVTIYTNFSMLLF